jgi:hypothetical protein
MSPVAYVDGQYLLHHSAAVQSKIAAINSPMASMRLWAWWPGLFSARGLT